MYKYRYLHNPCNLVLVKGPQDCLVSDRFRSQGYSSQLDCQIKRGKYFPVVFAF